MNDRAIAHMILLPVIVYLVAVPSPARADSTGDVDVTVAGGATSIAVPTIR